MKNYLLLAGLFFSIAGRTQEPTTELQQQLESIAERTDAQEEDGDWMLQSEELRKNPISINEADETALLQIRFLTGLQVAELTRYRKQIGPLLSLYELQAVPGWDLQTIRAVIPFLTINEKNPLKNWGYRLKYGEHNILWRISRSSVKTDYQGSALRLLFRYRYNYKSNTQWGITADKDAGEQFFKGSQKQGFDHYSIYFFARNMGLIKSLALGDFTVNLGQGLIHWQSLAFNKSSEVMNIKRQSEILRPYTSTGEFYYDRGIGITLGKNRWSLTSFASLRNLSGNLIRDSLTGEEWVSSLQTSGYHRTVAETRDKNVLQQFSYGGNISFRSSSFKFGCNLAAFKNNIPLRKAAEAYQKFSINGSVWMNTSIDYGFTFRNIHCFGEFGLDKNRNTALLTGMILSVDRRMDLSLLFRDIKKEYQSVNGNAFTEGTVPSNEIGTYIGICLRATDALTLQGYCDLFLFPWLKYRVDGPSLGKDLLYKIEFRPDKQTEIGWRWHKKYTDQNMPGLVTNALLPVSRETSRFYFSKNLGRQIILRHRTEFCRFRKLNVTEDGWLFLVDLIFKPPLKSFSTVARIAFFETDGYDSRIYAYENDLAYSFSIPTFMEKGWRYYSLVSYDVSRRISLWLRWSQTLYINTKGFRKSESSSEWKLQARLLF